MFIIGYKSKPFVSINAIIPQIWLNLQTEGARNGIYWLIRTIVRITTDSGKSEGEGDDKG